MTDFNVLLTGCSVFTKEIAECLKNNEDGANVKVIGVNCDKSQLPNNCLDYAYVVPKVCDPTYIDELIRICLLHNVRIVIPYLTCEIEILAEQNDKFIEKGILLSVSPIEQIRIANNKASLHSIFSRFMPRQKVLTCYTDIYDFIAQTPAESNICCKLCKKSGGQGFAIVDDVRANDISLLGRTGGKTYITTAQLEEMVLKSQEDIILQEYIKGFDYSVCLLLDHGRVVNEVGYIGYSINSGAIMQGEIVKHDKAYKIAEKICCDLNLDGNVCVDFIVNGNEATLLEVNPRINATIAFCSKAGVNLVYQRCKLLLGEEVASCTPKYGLKMKKYYAADYYI